MKNKKNKFKMSQKEIIITIFVLVGSVIIGFIIGKNIFEALYGKI